MGFFWMPSSETISAEGAGSRLVHTSIGDTTSEQRVIEVERSCDILATALFFKHNMTLDDARNRLPAIRIEHDRTDPIDDGQLVRQIAELPKLHELFALHAS